MSENHKEKKVRITGTDSTTPTTPFLSNPCKFRGKTIDILGILSNSGGMTTRKLSDQTGIPVRKVWTYCNNGEKKRSF
jgi:hypothetical protein